MSDQWEVAIRNASVYAIDNKPVGATPTDAHAKATLHHLRCQEIILSFPFDVDDELWFRILAVMLMTAN